MPSRQSIKWSTPNSDSGSDSGYSDTSDHSHSTAPTDYSRQPSLKYFRASSQQYQKQDWEQPSYDDYDEEDRMSVQTYASTVPSTEDLDDDLPPFEAPDYEEESFAPIAIGSTPAEFAEFFPSGRKLWIRHDDSTLDGNMNLRVDTELLGSSGRKVDLTLFHLRMHDLKNREFSLRRYCRDSGREVCNSRRKYTKPATISRPSLQRSMSNALSSIRNKSDSKTATKASLKRQDSGYDSMSEEDSSKAVATASPKGRSIPLPTNTTHLEFSNYAHLDVKRRGAKSSKRYEFEYWGTNYAWKRVAVRMGHFKEMSYRLVNTETMGTVAHIVPATMTTAEAQEENAKGGWVPPCLMWISDEKTISGHTDVADVIIATGLIALCDDTIKSRWHRKGSMHMTLPALMKSPLKMNMEYVGPKKLVDDVFNRSGKTATRPAYIRQISARA